uniref:Uncharacterized protein n=1 Tax=Myoviridae sp. ctVeR24 TaxID=2827689 RepID=A0A8S5SX23_9CAUD|nr:MAG TPA: hypothetical protein [Myoviridae sp. ctVeR24]
MAAPRQSANSCKHDLPLFSAKRSLTDWNRNERKQAVC